MRFRPIGTHVALGSFQDNEPCRDHVYDWSLLGEDLILNLSVWCGGDSGPNVA